MLGLPFRDDEWFGRVVNLSTGDDTTFEISRLDVMHAAERIRDSVQAMQVLLADPDRNAPRPISDFPLPEPERRRGCPYCPFYALCHEELEEADFAKWSSASPA